MSGAYRGLWPGGGGINHFVFTPTLCVKFHALRYHDHLHQTTWYKLNILIFNEHIVQNYEQRLKTLLEISQIVFVFSIKLNALSLCYLEKKKINIAISKTQTFCSYNVPHNKNYFTICILILQQHSF